MAELRFWYNGDYNEENIRYNRLKHYFSKINDAASRECNGECVKYNRIEGPKVNSHIKCKI